MTARALAEWRAVAGGVRADGSIVEMPPTLQRAQALDSWCQRYGCLPWPGSLMEQPAIPFLHWQNVLAAGAQEQASPQSADSLIASIPMVTL